MRIPSHPPELAKTNDGLKVMLGYLVHLRMPNDVLGGSVQ